MTGYYSSDSCLFSLIKALQLSDTEKQRYTVAKNNFITEN